MIVLLITLLPSFLTSWVDWRFVPSVRESICSRRPMCMHTRVQPLPPDNTLHSSIRTILVTPREWNLNPPHSTAGKRWAPSQTSPEQRPISWIGSSLSFSVMHNIGKQKKPSYFDKTWPPKCIQFVVCFRSIVHLTEDVHVIRLGEQTWQLCNPSSPDQRSQNSQRSKIIISQLTTRFGNADGRFQFVSSQHPNLDTRITKEFKGGRHLVLRGKRNTVIIQSILLSLLRLPYLQSIFYSSETQQL